MKTPYEILGVTKDDSIEHIKKCYRSLAMRNHPDRGGDAEKFTEITKAYEYIVNNKHQVYSSFDPSSDEFFKKMFGNNIGPWR